MGFRAVRVPSQAECLYKGYFSYFKLIIQSFGLMIIGALILQLATKQDIRGGAGGSAQKAP